MLYTAQFENYKKCTKSLKIYAKIPNQQMLHVVDDFIKKKKDEPSLKDCLSLYVSGIGLNHDSFFAPLAELAESKYEQITHATIAYTLKGFCQNHGVTTPKEQIEDLVENTLIYMDKEKIRNNINLCGFSYGADILCEIANSFLDKGINVRNIIFIDNNTSQYSGFITNLILEIENENNSNTSNTSKPDSNASKAKLMERMLNQETDRTKRKDILSYFMTIEDVNWDNLVVVAEYMKNNADIFYEKFANLLNRTPITNWKFFMTERDENEEEIKLRQRLYFKHTNYGLDNKAKKIPEVLRFHLEVLHKINCNNRISTIETHFDGINFTNISKIQRIFSLKWNKY